MPALSYGQASNVGRIRSHNEDTLRVEPDLGLWVVADGMGGHKGGETASAIAADHIVDSVKAGEPLAASVGQAHHAIKQASREGKGPEGMGTTVVALRVTDNQYEIAWVGDCRAYLWDGASLRQITKDHSYVQHLIDTGVISEADSGDNPYQDILLQALGAKDIDGVNVETISGSFSKNQKMLLCSDGLTKELDDNEIENILGTGAEEQSIVDQLIRQALKNGGRDNITAVLVSASDQAPDGALNPDPMAGADHKVGPTPLFMRLKAWLKRRFT